VTDQNLQWRNQKTIWAILWHISYNMFGDRARPYLHFEESLWDDLLPAAAESGINMVVMDLGDGIRYQSHPEISVPGAWSLDHLARQLHRMRELGLEPIPKLNFSSTHDIWLGEYARCLSTKLYYDVCSDLITELIELFETPRFFHLGMDEETTYHQRNYDYMVVRQGELWWHDLNFLVEQVERHKVRSWIWSDYVWHHPEEFFKHMPTAVLQSNWYYKAAFSEDIDRVRAYLDLDEHGYDQIPTGKYYDEIENFPNTVDFCGERVDSSRLKGFLLTLWIPTIESYRERHFEALNMVKQVRARFEDPRDR
jgi:hypothetical protein